MVCEKNPPYTAHIVVLPVLPLRGCCISGRRCAVGAIAEIRNEPRPHQRRVSSVTAHAKLNCRIKGYMLWEVIDPLAVYPPFDPMERQLRHVLPQQNTFYSE